MKDTDKIQKLINFVTDLAAKILDALEDGKIDLYEGLSIAPSLAGIVDIVKSKSEIKDEFLDLDPAEILDVAEETVKGLSIDADLKELVFEWTVTALTVSRSVRKTIAYAKQKETD